MDLVKIDIKNGRVPVVKQFKIRSIPYFILFDGDGKLVEKGGSSFFHSKIKGWKAPPKKVPTKKAEKIRDIVGAKKVDIQKALVKGQYTIFEFYADWCGICRKIGPQVEEKVKATKELYLRTIDVRSFQSPVAKQFNIKSLPYFIIYDPQGKIYKQGLRLYEEILQWKTPEKGTSKTPKKISLISKGEKVDLQKHLVKGKYTIVEFYADW